MKLVSALMCLLAFSTAHAGVDLVRIEIGKNYEGYTNDELRRRVWQLEKAVAQLQDQVFQLAVRDGGSRGGTGDWTCQIQSFSKTHIASGRTKARALAEALKKCSDATNAIHCHEEDVKCDNQ